MPCDDSSSNYFDILQYGILGGGRLAIVQLGNDDATIDGMLEYHVKIPMYKSLQLYRLTECYQLEGRVTRGDGMIVAW